MTCIIGLVDKNNVYIAGDSASCNDTNIIIRNDKKIFSNKSFIFGFSSSFRMGQLLKYNLDIPNMPNNLDLYDYMGRYFVDAVRNCLSDGGYMIIENKAEQGGQFLVGIDNRLFFIDSDFQVCESNNEYMAIGCGANYALGSLFSTTNISNPLIRIKFALQAAQYFDASVVNPFYYITTKDKNIEELYIER